MLHPQYKTQYFTEQEWWEDWITTARGILRNEWNGHYKPEALSVPMQPVPAPTAAKKAELFTALSKRHMTAPKGTEMETYIHEEPLMSEFTDDPIKYWSAKSSDPFAKLALDFLSAPGKSTDCL